MKICKIEDCDNKCFCKGYCMMHYKRYSLTGNPLKTPTGRVHGKRSICIIEKCNNVVEGNNYCRKHYRRWKLYGNPHTLKNNNSGYHLSGEGYVILYKPKYKWRRKDNTILEHRYVMEIKLNRKLEKHEIVHHKNGNRQDNRLKNLELKTIKTHYPGSDLCRCPNCGYEF